MLELFRVDDRLIHGQVVLGWGQPLNVGFIVLVDDAMVGSDWERELYRMGTPPQMDLFFESVESAARRMAEFQARADVGILLTGDVATMERLTAASPGIPVVTIGGLHHRAGRTHRLPYVFLAPDDEAAIRAMTGRGVSVVAQDVPASSPVPADELLDRGAA